MKTYKRLLPLFSLIFFVCLFVFGCSTTPKAFNPNCNPCISVERFYDSLREVYAICGQGNVGCHKEVNGVHWIHSIKSRCVVDHENDHKYYDSFHTIKASCKVRYED